MKSAPGPRPSHPSLKDAPAPGPIMVQVVKVRGTDKGTGYTVSGVLLGPGRDFPTAEAARENAREFNAMQDVVRCTRGDVYETVSDLVAEWPEAEANLDGTARRLLAAERARVEHAEAVARWAKAVEEAGREVCDRCGGAGGYAGWPGFTCYECNGAGTVEAN
jgi:hypothetical protein